MTFLESAKGAPGFRVKTFLLFFPRKFGPLLLQYYEKTQCILLSNRFFLLISAVLYPGKLAFFKRQPSPAIDRWQHNVYHHLASQDLM